MKIRTRLYWGIGALALVAGAVTVAPAAQANVINAPEYTNANMNAVSGYFANHINVTFTHIEGYLGSNGTTSLENLGQTTGNGAGVGLCNQSTGEALQGGIVYNGGHTKNVDFASGPFGPAQSNGNPCENGTLGSPQPFTQLQGISVSDTIAFQILYDGHHAHNGCHAGQALFEASDVTTHPGVWFDSPCVSVPHGTVFNEADAGVVADKQGMTPPATQYLATFAHLGLTAFSSTGHVVHGSFQNNPTWSAFPVFSTTNGFSSGGKVLAPQTFANDHFDELAGTPNSI
jgi:hypothetical protein